MKKTIPILSCILLSATLLPVLAQNSSSTGASNNENPMIQIQDRDRVQDQTNIDDSDGVNIQIQNMNEIRTIMINRGEENGIQVQTQTEEMERINYPAEEGEQVLLQLQTSNMGVNKQLQIRKNSNNDTFIEDGGTEVKANFPMEIDAETGLVTITNPNGRTVTLNATPSEVLEKVLSERLIEDVDEFEIEEDNDNEIKYILRGTTKRQLLGLFEINVPVEAKVNCENIDEVEVRKPWYLNMFGFLFTEPKA